MALIGVEAHIVAELGLGPRHRAMAPGEYDLAQNLILLCRNCHQIVDDQPETYTEEVLIQLKAQHEGWVQSRLEWRPSDGDGVVMISPVASGKQLIDILGSADATQFDHPDAEDDIETDLLSDLADLGEVADMAEFGEAVRLSVQARKLLDGLDACGLKVWSGQRMIPLTGRKRYDGTPVPDSYMRVAVIVVRRERLAQSTSAATGDAKSSGLS
jgi:hypothetical protein